MNQSPIDSQIPSKTALAMGKFVKVFVAGTEKAGQYRGQGNLRVTANGLVITGNHVYTMGQRWLFGIGMVFAVALLTLGTFAPGILIVYGVVEYLWLKNGNQTIPFDRIKAFKSVAKKKLIAIQFTGGTPWETPVVLKSDQWQLVYDALTSRVPRARLA